ncbi:MAG: radical SAM protein [Thiofilum sp.]|uniref:radical SAM protein n=1 Tax=Thiofilum sp. TaxID=2212733 RepID=UPI0025F2D679|nr:radical SAM protein [Thiofilum sp.]MBK8452151.1 B12-binding domain-containing radical SAM protein [Thiofilum sp.]
MYFDPPFDYIEPVFRPPSEADSLILQVTNGCSWNQCSFCEMYTAPQKKFRPKNETEILAEIKHCGETMAGLRRIFLADGDAMALSFRRLEAILTAINDYLPSVSRISAYCLPQNVKNKTIEQLQHLRELGLSLAYIGAESGDDTILKKVNKSETFASTREAILKLKAAGIKTSVMIINGLGGKQYSTQHALNSARLINETQPEYLATLVLFFSHGSRRFIEHFGNDYEPCTMLDLFQEMHTFISHLTLEKTILRSDHVSNSLVLKGVLGKDKATLLQQIEQALEWAKHHPTPQRVLKQY